MLPAWIHRCGLVSKGRGGMLREGGKDVCPVRSSAERGSYCGTNRVCPVRQNSGIINQEYKTAGCQKL